MHKIGYHTQSQLIQITLSPQSLTELGWWTSPDLTEHNKMSLQPPPIDKTITTEASTKRGGAVCLETRTGGSGAAARPCCTSTTWNSTAVAHINKKGGTRSSKLTVLALDIWTYCPLRQCGGGLYISTFQQPHRADAELQDFPTNNGSILHPASGPLCVHNQQPATSLCVPISRSWILGNRCVLAGLQPMDRVYPSTNSPDPANATPDEAEQGNRSDDCPSMAGTTFVPRPFGNAGGLPSTFSSIPVNNFPSFHSGRSSSNVENPSVFRFGRFHGTSPSNRASRRSVTRYHCIMAKRYIETVRGTMEIIIKLVYSKTEVSIFSCCYGYSNFFD